MSAVAYVDFVAAQCLVSISNRSAVPEAARLKVPGEGEAARELRDPRDAWKDYCALLAIAKSLLELNKYRPLPAPFVCADSLESPDEDAGSDSDAATKQGSSPTRIPPPGPLPRLRAAGAAPKGKLAAEKRHKCPFSGCGKVYGRFSHLKAHYRVHTEKDQQRHCTSCLCKQSPCLCCRAWVTPKPWKLYRGWEKMRDPSEQEKDKQQQISRVTFKMKKKQKFSK